MSSFGPGFVPISSCRVQDESTLNCTLIEDASCDHSMDLGVVCRTLEQLHQEQAVAQSTTTITALGVATGILVILLLGTVTALVAMAIMFDQ